MIEGGLDYLVSSWERTASAVAAGDEAWAWEEWVNDLDTRQILQDVLDHVPESAVALEAVERADTKFAASTRTTNECQWYEDVAAREGWTPDRNWWYWRAPPTPYES